MKFRDIPQFTRAAPYNIDLPWSHLENQLEAWADRACGNSMDLDPDFQRGHVWTPKKQKEYVEFILRGGQSSKDIYLNHPQWGNTYKGVLVLVDGKQRLEAVRKFLANKFKAFGRYCNEYEGRIPWNCGFKVHINDLKTKAEVLQWYLDLNTGGVVHTDEEINKVKRLLKKEKKELD